MTHGVGGGDGEPAADGGGRGGKQRGSASSWSPPSSPCSSSGDPVASKIDAVASEVVSASQEEAITPPSPPRSTRLGKGRGQGKRKGIICKRAVWSRQGTVARLVYQKTTGRGAPGGGRDHSGGGTASGATRGATGDNVGGSSSSSSGGGGGASDPEVFPSDRDEGRGDTSSGDACEEEMESSSSNSSSSAPPKLEECSFWAPCSSGDKVKTCRSSFPSCVFRADLG